MIRTSIDKGKLREMKEALARNYKWAYVATLTYAVRETAEDIKGGLRVFFTLRNQYVKGGIRSTAAKIGDKVPTAIVGAIAPAANKGRPFLQKHVKGGERDMGKKGQSAIPIGARPSPGLWTKPPLWPSALLRKDGKQPKRGGVSRVWLKGKRVTVPGRTLQQAKRFNRTFILRSRGREYVVTRLSRGTKARLKFWYLFIQKARIKADWPFYDYERTVLYHFKRNFAQKLKENL